MQLTTWIGATLGLVMVVGGKLAPPPVILDLGPVVPTPVPTPKGAEKKRLITTITVQNAADGDSVIQFEATDVADEGGGKIRVIAAKTYSLAEDKPELVAARDRIVEHLRALEREMLVYVDQAGPPKPRVPLQGGQRP